MAATGWTASGTRTVLDDGTATGTGLNVALTGLLNAAASATYRYDNRPGQTGNGVEYALIEIELASVNLSAVTAPSLTIALAYLSNGTAFQPDNTALQGGGEQFSVPVLKGAGAQVHKATKVVPLFGLPIDISIVNLTGASLTTTGNKLAITPLPGYTIA